MSIGGWVIAIMQKSKMAAAMLNFIFVQYFSMHVCKTLNVIHMPNFVQVCLIVNDYER